MGKLLLGRFCSYSPFDDAKIGKIILSLQETPSISNLFDMTAAHFCDKNTESTRFLSHEGL